MGSADVQSRSAPVSHLLSDPADQFVNDSDLGKAS